MVKTSTFSAGALKRQAQHYQDMADHARLIEENKRLRDALKVCSATLVKRGMPTQHEMLEAARQARAALAQVAK